MKVGNLLTKRQPGQKNALTAAYRRLSLKFVCWCNWRRFIGQSILYLTNETQIPCTAAHRRLAAVAGE